MHSKYAKGARFENEVKDILTEDGWIATRSAGSHGIIDVLAIKVDVKWFIQCRTSGKLSGDERVELITLAKKHKAVPILAYKSKDGIVFQEIKPKEPDFHYEVIEGRFVKTND